MLFKVDHYIKSIYCVFLLTLIEVVRTPNFENEFNVQATKFVYSYPKIGHQIFIFIDQAQSTTI